MAELPAVPSLHLPATPTEEGNQDPELVNVTAIVAPPQRKQTKRFPFICYKFVAFLTTIVSFTMLFLVAYGENGHREYIF